MVLQNTNHKNSLIKRVQCLKNGQGRCSVCGQIFALSTGVLLKYRRFNYVRKSKDYIQIFIDVYFISRLNKTERNNRWA